MARIGTAFRLFFRALKDQDFADRARLLLDGGAVAPPSPGALAPVAPATTARPAPKTEAARSDALNLLAVLQREARLVDFLKENIAPYDDAQVGAAVRDVHRDAASALERIFTLRPVMTEAEGAAVIVAAGADAARVRLTGNVTGQPPFRGTLRHQGWEAEKVQLPEWTGSTAAARVVAPAEVELT
ncbi:MAG TPA: DUF2760 domain-containing protein [Tepidisphaeraceae bacterium]|jgi:hypothetical protein|nr:DUF2760 domain-containing protein [Tepidisphaeraceae bacterium]